MEADLSIQILSRPLPFLYLEQQDPTLRCWNDLFSSRL
jgi:hypothetical protein